MVQTQERMKLEIPTIIERFDFDKVHKHMIEVNWQWRGEGVPSIDDLKRTAILLLVDVVESKDEFMSVGTGGFRAYKFPWGIEIIFALERKGSY